jgi:hypothetical protein
MTQIDCQKSAAKKLAAKNRPPKIGRQKLVAIEGFIYPKNSSPSRPCVLMTIFASLFRYLQNILISITFTETQLAI